MPTQRSRRQGNLPSERQVGGDHYKNYCIQPFEFIYRNRLDFFQGTIIKYVLRYESKGNPIEDLDKMIHYCELTKEQLQEV